MKFYQETSNQFLSPFFLLCIYFLGQHNYHHQFNISYKYQAPMTNKLQIQIDSDEEQEAQYITEGGGMSYMTKNKRLFLKLAPYDPKFHHRVIDDGLNMQGICANENCSVEGQYIWAHKGYGHFSIVEQIDQIKCPICKENVPRETVINLGYKNCNVKIVGRKVGDSKKFQWQDKENEGKFVRFQGYGRNKGKWMQLDLMVAKL